MKKTEMYAATARAKKKLAEGYKPCRETKGCGCAVKTRSTAKPAIGKIIKKPETENKPVTENAFETSAGE